MKQKVKVLIIFFLLSTSAVNLFDTNPGTEKNNTRKVKGFIEVEASSGIDVFISNNQCPGLT